MNKISVVVSAYNEEKNLDDCLKSVKGHADEIIVVDNSSQDRTAEIAKKYTKKVYTQENNPDKIDVQKNFGFSKATGDWVFSLDADERATAELWEEIKNIVSSNEVNGYWIPRKNIIFGKWIKSEMWWPDYQLKIFRCGKGAFNKNKVHKALEVEGPTEKLNRPLLHENYKSISQYLIKLNSYTDIEAESLSREGYKFNFLDAIRFPIDDFVKTFFLQKGYREGLHGLILSLLQAFYMEAVFAKLWEKNGFREIEDENFVKEVNRELKSAAGKVRYWFASALINDSKNPLKKFFLRASRKVISSELRKTRIS